MDLDRDAHFDSRPDGICIQSPAASGHVSDGFAEVVGPRASGFLKHDSATRAVLGNGASAHRRCRGRSF